MTANQIATIAWGLFTLLLTFYAAQIVSSFWAMALTILAAGCTYLFQVLQEIEALREIILYALWFTVIASTLAAWVLIVCA